MALLPNGFTGFNNLDPEFESAGAASRRVRGVDDESNRPAPAGSFQYARDLDSGRRVESELPFDDVDTIVNPESLGALEQRWAWIEVDLAAIRHNITETRRFINQQRTELMAVVKADAYGHGAVEVANAALSAGASRLGVATVPEALELRAAGITAPILVLSEPPATSIPLLLAHHITPTVYDPSFAVAYGESADLHGMIAPYHLAVNTGMNRIGVRYDDVVEFLRQVGFHRALELEGTFTHFATAELPETMEFKHQLRRFYEAVGDMDAAGFNPGIIHAANSAAIYRYPEVHFDMVRLGVAMYGLHPCAETRQSVDLHPAMSVHARIVDARQVPMSEGVSYGLSYRSPGHVKICTLPIGYADGLRRGLSGKIDFVFRGRYFRQVGEICMDHCMFEADMRTFARRETIDPQVGDEVLVVGSQGAAEVTLDELAEKLGTNHYEVAIGFGMRLARMYK